ncbi:superoxide dismutase domain protein [Mycobacterium kansasii]|uniref:Superoxide dismutase domain protein n=1 Tax=Mycobacterium kansasii TaxID=1768 RepID=A0A1V3XVW0_MYCKA|nr:superoxide dismutase domain protein [Mycobacterium kansasii]OOK83222.1 superoxide dismutase domain protein [Mycobacterium kansasii]
MISAVPELFRRSAAVNEFEVVTSFAAPSERTSKEVRSPLAG